MSCSNGLVCSKQGRTMNTLEVTNPFNNDPVGELPLSSWDGSDSMLNCAILAFADRRNWLPTTKRIDVLEKTAAIMQQRSEELSMLISSEGGKPLIDARVEVERAIDGVKLCIKELEHLTGTEVPMGAESSQYRANCLHFSRIHRSRGGCLSVQSSTELDRSPSGICGGRRMSGDHQTSRTHTTECPCFCRHSL